MKNGQLKDKYFRGNNPGVGKFVRKTSNKKARQAVKRDLECPTKLGYSGYYH